MSTKIASASKVSWHLVDAKGQVLGRLATQLATILRGKHKPTYAPNVDCGDHLVVVNAKDIVLTGNKWKDKLYRWHTGYPGGLKQRTAKEMFDKKPEEILTKAVFGMLPKNKMRALQIKKLHVFMEDQHSYPNEIGQKGGPKILPMRYLINLQKGLTIIMVFGLMNYYNNFTLAPYLYMANHGTYGILWLLKDQIFPDPNWERKIPALSAIALSLGLLGYWAAAYIVVGHRVKVSPERAFLVVMMHTFGCVLMMASDTQKYFTLKYRKGLISEGWFSRCRNTNYLGEVMLYSSYAILAQHWFPWCVNLSIWTLLFITNMLRKEESLRKKTGATEYFKKSSMFLPNLYGWFVDTFLPNSTIYITPEKSRRAKSDTKDNSPSPPLRMSSRKKTSN